MHILNKLRTFKGVSVYIQKNVCLSWEISVYFHMRISKNDLSYISRLQQVILAQLVTTVSLV